MDSDVKFFFQSADRVTAYVMNPGYHHSSRIAVHCGIRQYAVALISEALLADVGPYCQGSTCVP